MSAARVVDVHLNAEHGFSKRPCREIVLKAGLGVEGDAHCGAAVRHRSRVAADPSQPNLRQVHLIQSEMHDELASKGFAVKPGALGENITTRGIDLLALPTGTVLRLGAEALVCLTGLRNPCGQIESFQPGLLAEVLARDELGRVQRRAGVMGVVILGGRVTEGDPLVASLPASPHVPLARV